MNHDTLIVGYLKPHKSFMKASEVSQISRFSGETPRQPIPPPQFEFEHINAPDLPTRRYAMKYERVLIHLMFIILWEFCNSDQHIYLFCPWLRRRRCQHRFRRNSSAKFAFIHPYRSNDHLPQIIQISHIQVARIFIYFIIYYSLSDMYGLRLPNWKPIINILKNIHAVHVPTTIFFSISDKGHHHFNTFAAMCF